MLYSHISTEDCIMQKFILSFQAVMKYFQISDYMLDHKIAWINSNALK